MKIKLISGYRGVLTDEEWFPAGEYSTPKEITLRVAKLLVKNGRAEDITPRKGKK